MILSNIDILEAYNNNLIDVNPWDKHKLGPNSYDVCLGNIIKCYKDVEPLHNNLQLLDPKKDNETYELPFYGTKPDFWIFYPNVLYLGSTLERVKNHAQNIVPMLEGRSSVARLGISIHSTAGFGDIGYCGYWTLEITVAHPIIIYPKMPIAQLSWMYTKSLSDRMYRGKYQHSEEPISSKLYEEYR